MDNFSHRIFSVMDKKGLIFPGISQNTVLDKIVPIAEEWILMQIVTKHLSPDEQILFRDSYISAPDVFDSSEFLSDILPDLDVLIKEYFEVWLGNF